MINKEFSKNLENYYDFMIEDYISFFRQIVITNDSSYLDDFRMDLNEYAKKLYSDEKFKREYCNFINLNIDNKKELEYFAFNTIDKIEESKRESFITFVNKLFFSIVEESFKNKELKKDLLIFLENQNLLSNNAMERLALDLMGNVPILGNVISKFRILYSVLLILIGIYINSFGNIEYAHSKNSNKCHKLDCRFIKNVKYVNLRIVSEQELENYDKCKSCS